MYLGQMKKTKRKGKYGYIEFVDKRKLKYDGYDDNIEPEIRKPTPAEREEIILNYIRDNRGECDIPDDLLKEIARCLVPDIIAFFETEEAKREFEAWKAEQEKKIADKAKNEAMPRWLDAIRKWSRFVFKRKFGNQFNDS